MRRPRALPAIFAITLIMGGAWFSLAARHEAEPGIPARCHASAGEGPEGRVVIDRPTRIAGLVDLPVACRLVLLPGARLTLDGVDLRAPGLFIGDEAANGAGSVEILNSTLTGADGGVLQIVLTDADDSIMVDRSTIDFPAAVWAVSGDNGSGGSITAHRSTIRSRGPGTRGVVLMAGERGGRAVFADLTLEVPDGDVALLLAGECAMDRVTGGPPRCSP